MKIVFTIDGERKEVDVKRAMLYDASGNRYRISEDFEHGLEILAEDFAVILKDVIQMPDDEGFALGIDHLGIMTKTKSRKL